MHKIISLFCFILLLNQNALCAAITTQEDPDIAKILQEHNVQGTVIIASLNNETSFIHNKERANERLSPASTFKIPNSLIAIEEKILTDQYEVIKWDGKKRFLDAWNKDQNLKSAFRHSCVWFYQELAKKIKADTYFKYFAKLNYGNQLLGKNITNFWLGEEGDLKISPLEQMEFLQKIYKKQLPLSENTFDILQNIMLEEETDNYKLYSKTGAATKDWIGHGWYIGYITTANHSWFFVTNILINGQEDLKKRKDVTIAALKKKSLINSK